MYYAMCLEYYIGLLCSFTYTYPIDCSISYLLYGAVIMLGLDEQHPKSHLGVVLCCTDNATNCDI